MPKGRELKGRKVLAADGRLLGSVADVVLNISKGCICGLLVETDAVLPRLRYLPLSAVDAWEKDIVRLREDAALCKTEKLQERQTRGGMLGLLVRSAEGTQQGKVADLFLDLPSGRLSGLELSGGFWHDLQHGRGFLPWERLVLQEVAGELTLMEKDGREGEAFDAGEDKG